MTVCHDLGFIFLAPSSKIFLMLFQKDSSNSVRNIKYLDCEISVNKKNTFYIIYKYNTYKDLISLHSEDDAVHRQFPLEKQSTELNQPI